MRLLPHSLYIIMRFLALLKNDFIKLFTSYGFWTAFLLFGGYCVYAFFLVQDRYLGLDMYKHISATMGFALDNHNFGFAVVSNAFLVCGLPFSASYVSDTKCRILSILLTKTTRTKYCASRLITCFIGSYLVIFLPLMLNQLLCLGYFDMNALVDDFTNGPAYTNLFGELQSIPFSSFFQGNPLLYNVSFSALLAFVCGLLAMLAFSVSLLITKLRIIPIAVPYVASCVITFVHSIVPGTSEFLLPDERTYISLQSFLCIRYYGLKYDWHIFVVELLVIAFITVILAVAFSRKKTDGVAVI